MSDRQRRPEVRHTRLIAARVAELRAYARDEAAVTADIDVTASRRLNLYRHLAEQHSEMVVETIDGLSRQLDYLYEELRISRMVAA